MNKKHRLLLDRIELQLLRLRGCLDAMTLIDDNIPMQQLETYRNSSATLHMIMDIDLKEATSTLDAIFSGHRR